MLFRSGEDRVSLQDVFLAGSILPDNSWPLSQSLSLSGIYGPLSSGLAGWYAPRAKVWLDFFTYWKSFIRVSRLWRYLRRVSRARSATGL